MTKQDIIDAVALATGNTKAKVTEILESYIAITTATVNSGEEVQWRGFGTFRNQRVAARVGRNPRTGESIQIPEKNLVKFKSAKTWDDKAQ